MTGNAALRRKDGSCVLVVIIRHAECWGIYQLQLGGAASDQGEWELIQARGSRDEAMAEALAGSRRAGLIE
jgi:hypothetical protein